MDSPKGTPNLFSDTDKPEINFLEIYALAEMIVQVQRDVGEVQVLLQVPAWELPPTHPSHTTSHQLIVNMTQ